MKIADAWQAYLRDLEMRNIRRSTRENYLSLFRQLEAFAAETGINSLEGIDRDAVRSWREQWDCAYSTQRRRLGQLKAFFSYAIEVGWISESPMKGIRSPKSDARPTMPLSVDEMRSLLAASRGKLREEALLLMMRYSGLAIMDAATLECSAVQSTGELVLRRSKSGELVTVLLPEQAVQALRKIPKRSRKYFFWSGTSHPETAAKYWRERLKAVAAAAGVEGFHPHRLRDTFAVELLLAGVPIDDVSTLLGHSSVRTTELYYAPWNGARRRRLVALVRDVHRQDPILLDIAPKRPVGRMGAVPKGASATQSLRSQIAHDAA